MAIKWDESSVYGLKCPVQNRLKNHLLAFPVLHRNNDKVVVT